MTADSLPTPDPEQLPVRVLNEYAYCPRLFHLMHVEGRWADNVFTLDGKQVHRRVDQVDHVLPDPDRAEPATAADSATGGDEPPEISRSVALSSDTLGLTGKLDRDDALPFYVQTQGAIVGKSGNCLTVRKEGGELAKAHLKDVSQLVLCGNIMVTAQTFHLLCEAGVPIVHLSSRWKTMATTSSTASSTVNSTPRNASPWKAASRR